MIKISILSMKVTQFKRTTRTTATNAFSFLQLKLTEPFEFEKGFKFNVCNTGKQIVSWVMGYNFDITDGIL